MVGHQVLVLSIEVRILVPQLVKKMLPQGSIFCYKLEVRKVWETFRQGFEGVVDSF